MATRRRETATLKRAADAFRALGHPDRLRIAQALGAQEACVCELVEALGMRQPTISQHLSVLRRAGLVVGVRDGLFVRYRLNGLLAARLLAAAGLPIAGDRSVGPELCEHRCEAGTALP